jgi:hypothetical protein
MGHADNFNTEARERWIDDRANVVTDHVINGGTMRVAPLWALPDANGRQVPVVIDFIAWIYQERKGDADLAHCLYAPNTRRIRLICDYAEARAIAECNQLPADYFAEVA